MISHDVELTAELRFRQESIRRAITEFYEKGEYEALVDAADLLNVLWHQQCAIARWLAHEAAENLGEAWQASRHHDPQ